jgi:hypothetical protein
MQLLNRAYIKLYFLVLLLYVFFNKGVAYSYMAETLLFSGIFLLFINRKQFEIGIDRKQIIIGIFIIISFLFLLVGVLQYSIFNVLRDSLAFQYAWFAFIIYFFKNEYDFIWQKIIQIYKWVPFVLFLNFSLFYFVFLYLPPINIFGNQNIIIYKNGDKSVHLLISTILMFLYTNQYSRKWLVANTILIVINFLILLAFTRSGSVAYILALFSFFFFSKEKILNESVRKLLKFVPIIMVIGMGLFVAIDIQGDAQGRTISLTQITDNFSSIVSTNIDGNLAENKVWRLIWWAKLINESFTLQHFFVGKGLGMSLAGNDILNTDDNLRSPHNFHLTILARFGYFVFIAWIIWLVSLFKPLFTRKLAGKTLAITSILLAFIINGSFDVFFEGPMGAFPFWTFVGLLFIENTYGSPTEIPS